MEVTLHFTSYLFFGILIDDWYMLASHSGLFDARGRILSIMWWRNLQLDVEFDDFKSLRTKDNLHRLQFFASLSFRRTESVRSVAVRF